MLDQKAQLLAVVEAASKLLPYDWTGAGWDAGRSIEMHDRMNALVIEAKDRMRLRYTFRPADFLPTITYDTEFAAWLAIVDRQRQKLALAEGLVKREREHLRKCEASLAARREAYHQSRLESTK